MQTKKSFLSPSLQKINIEAEDVITKHRQELDRISNDIKALEESLKNSGIPFTFYYVLSSETCRYSRTAYQFCSPYEQVPYTADFVEQTDNCLVWNRCEDGQYRFSYNIYITENEIDKYEDGDGQNVEKVRNDGVPKLTFSKPLIETKAHFRVKIEKELGPFYKAIIDALKTKSDQERVFEYSLNYNIPFCLAKIDNGVSF